MDIAEKLAEELNVETVFTIRAGALEIPVNESTVVSWILIGIVFIICQNY